MSSRRGFREEPTIEGFSSGAFFTMLIFTIIVAIVLIVVLYLYFRQDASKISASECPEAVTGILVNPGKRVAAVAENCGTNANCQYIVNSVAAGVQICADLGSSKCAAFTLTQIPDSDDFDMVVSEFTDTIDVAGADTLRIIN